MKANKVSNNDVRKFTEELSKSLEIDNLLIYNLPIDNGKFTDENLVKLEEKYKDIIDKEKPQNVYYQMKEYETNLLNEQQKYLKKMRKNGELYYVKTVERRLQILENRTYT